MLKFIQEMSFPRHQEHRREVCRINNLGEYKGFHAKPLDDGGFEVMTVGDKGFAKQKYKNGEWQNLEMAAIFWY